MSASARAMAVFALVSVGSTVSRKTSGDITVAADQVLVEVPVGNIPGTRLRCPFVEGMRAQACTTFAAMER